MHTIWLDVTTRTPPPITISSPNLHCSPPAPVTPPNTITDTETGRPTVPTLGRTLAIRSCARCSKTRDPASRAPDGPSETRNSTVPSFSVFGATHTIVEYPRTSPSTTDVPKRHDALPTSPCTLPYTDTVTNVPPWAGALLGITEEMPRPASKMSCLLDGPASTPLLLTPTRTVPAPLTGAMHVTSDEETYSAATEVSTPIRQLKPWAFLKCRPTTVITWLASPATAHAGSRLSTIVSSSISNVRPVVLSSRRPSESNNLTCIRPGV